MPALYDATGSKQLGFIDGTRPVCGEDFCDTCGDCLACYAGDPCGGYGGDHRWLVYEDRLPGFLEEHEDAKVNVP